MTPFDGGTDHRSPSPEDNSTRVFEFLRERRHLGTPADWEPVDAQQLWRYHLGYFEWAWSFEAHPDRDWARRAFADLWREWRSSARFGRWDAWSPYVVSLRAWVFCNVHRTLVSGSDIEADFVQDLALHARFLEHNLERDVGGNHLVKNLKALVGLGAFLGDDRVVRRAITDLEAQLGVQILADGGHFERSPSYHAQVLVDLVDVASVLTALGRSSPTIGDAVAAMRAWLAAVLLPDGEVPLVNDCVPVGRETMSRLGTVSGAPARLTVLHPSGYVIARPDSRAHILLDIGPPCPPELPAHAHADCLNLLLTVDGNRILTDTGTSTYAPGERRRRERSTVAHNTVAIDGSDQTEVWGTFRAARLAEATIEEASDDGSTIRVAGSHDGYTRLTGRPVHGRTITARSGAIEVTDEITGAGRHTVEANLYSPLAGISTPAGVALGPITIGHVSTSAGDLSWTAEPAELARGFGHVAPGTRLRAHATVTLPVRWTWTITVGDQEGDA